jgi:hypothetical protein
MVSSGKCDCASNRGSEHSRCCGDLWVYATVLASVRVHWGGLPRASSHRAVVVCWSRDDRRALVPAVPSPALVEKHVGIRRAHSIRAHFRDIRIVVVVPLSGANLGQCPGVCVVVAPRKTWRPSASLTTRRKSATSESSPRLELVSHNARAHAGRARVCLVRVCLHVCRAGSATCHHSG